MKLSAEDRLDLMDLCARYFTCIDEKDADGFMRCWADDDDIIYESPQGDVKGRQEMREFFDHHVNHGMGVGKRHLLGNVTIREGEDQNTAYTTFYMIILEVVDNPRITATAMFRNSKAVRTAAGWQFQHKKLDIDPGVMKLMAQSQQMQQSQQMPQNQEMISMTTPVESHVITPDEGQSVWFLGKAHMTLKVTGEQTNGVFSLIEEALPPGYSTFYHKNRAYDQLLYVIEGELSLVHNNEKSMAGPGTTIYLPRNTPNGFKVEGTTPARLLLLITPAGFEHFFVEGGEPAVDMTPPANWRPDWNKLKAVGAKYDHESLGPLPV